MCTAFTRNVGLFCAAVLHCFIILSFPLGAVQEWNICNLLFAFYLFSCETVDVSEQAMSISMDARLAVILMFTLFLVPLICNLSPDSVDFLLGFRYYAGNWEQSTWLVRKRAWDSLVMPNVVARNKLYSTRVPYFDVCAIFGFRIMATPTGKALLRLLQRLLLRHHGDIGHKLRCDEYMLLDEGTVINRLYGWSWAWNERNVTSLKARLDAQGVSQNINRLDVIVLYISAVPTFSLCQPASFKWKILDFNSDVIEQGRWTVREIDDTPHFT